MRARDRLAFAAEALARHRLRTGLTALAVAVGATAVLLLTALAGGARAYVVRQFADLGSNLVVISPGRTTTTGLGSMMGGGTRPLTIADSEALRTRVRGLQSVAPLSLGSGPVEFAGRHRDVYVIGATAAYADVQSIRMASGTFLPPGDPEAGGRVVVLGSRLARELFGGQPAVGQPVRIAEARFRVAGVMASKGPALGYDFDDTAIVPVGSGLRLFDQANLHHVILRATDPSALPGVLATARAVLIDRHRDEDFTLETPDAMIESFRSIMDALTLALAAIGAISLTVAGIGIMNVMLVSVSERVAEVGLFKALGAPRAEILGLFLVEAVLLAGAGAACGVGAGALFIALAGRLWPRFPLAVDPGWTVAVLALCLVGGAVFGLVPARRASALAPVDALRGRR